MQTEIAVYKRNARGVPVFLTWIPRPTRKRLAVTPPKRAKPADIEAFYHDRQSGRRRKSGWKIH